VIGFQSTHRDIFLPAYLSVYPGKHIIIWVPLYHRNAMSKMKMDAVDASLLVLNTMSAFLIVGIGKFDLFGVDFAATLFSPAGFGLSTAWGSGYAAITTTILTNDNAELSSLGNDIKNLGSYYMIAAAATLLLPIALLSSLIPSAHFSNRLISGVWSTSLSSLRDRLLWGGCYNGVCF